MNLCLIVGHNRKSAGAMAPIHGSENTFARKVCGYLLEFGVDADVLTRRYVEGRGYTAEMKEELEVINAGNYDLCIEIHFNSSSNPDARGCEVLAHKNSTKGQAYGRAFCKALNALTGIPIRRGDGILPVSSVEERGGTGICLSKPPYILIEPFFASNNLDCEAITHYAVAEAIAGIIRNGKL